MAHYLDRSQDSQYKFEIDGLELPIAPSALTIKVNNKNETLTLINEGEVNIPKLPGLSEISFTARIPQTQYPFANKLQSAAVFTDKFKALKLSKQPFKLTISRINNKNTILNRDAILKYSTDKIVIFIGNKPVDKTVIVRTVINPYGSSTFNVVLEDYTIKEDAEEGFDLLIDLNFKEYVEYSTKVYKTAATSTTDGEENVLTPAVTTSLKSFSESSPYKVQSGDTLWKIARKFYGGTGSDWKLIYDANKTTIESKAKQNGKASSSNGSLIYAGTELTIPKRN